MQGESRRIEALGYRMSGNACYVLCSLECIDFYHKEVEPSTSDSGVVAPHQMEVVEAYEHEGSTAEGTAEGTGSAEGVAPSASTVSLQEGGDSAAPLNSLGHALNNCLLDDIRERLGYPKPTTTSNTTTTTPAVDNSSSTSTDANSTAINALTKNLTPDSNLRLSTRFVNLGEIPNFQFRLNKVSSRVKSLLFKLVTDMMRYQQSILTKLTSSTSNNNLTTTAENNNVENNNDNESSDEEDGIADTIGISKLADHTGVSTELDVESISRVFLHTVSSIARAHRSELFPLAEVLGICFVQPILRAPVNFNSENNQKFQYEPKFW